MCSETFISRKPGGRERVRKLNREERTPSWLEPGYGHDIHSPSKRNSHVPNLQRSPFTSHSLPVNRDGHRCILRGSVSQSWNCLPSPRRQQFLHRVCSFHVQREIRKMNEMSFLSATRNPSMALTYDAKWKDCTWNAASSFQKLSANVPGSDAPPLCQAYLHFHISFGPVSISGA